MKGDPQVIAHLQAQLKNELTAINQYFLHYRMLKHWGFDKLAKKEYEESIGEMKHADWLMDRIFMLDRPAQPARPGQAASGRGCARNPGPRPALGTRRPSHHQGRHGPLRKRARLCLARPAAKILDDTEEHIDFLETQIDLIEKVGLPTTSSPKWGC